MLTSLVWFMVGMIGVVYPLLVAAKLKPRTKRVAVRWFAILWAASVFFFLVIPSTSRDDLPVVLVFVLPALGVLAYAIIRLTKVCPYCGYAISGQRPYINHKICPVCGTPL